MANKVIFSQYAIPQEQLVEGGPWTYDSNVGKILKGTAEISYTGAFHEQHYNVRGEVVSTDLPNDIVFLYICNFGYGLVDLWTGNTSANAIVHLYAGDFFACKYKPGAQRLNFRNSMSSSLGEGEDSHIYIAYVTN
jgi:hypothetical protein